jgi:MSHA pilin protein MshC
MVATLLLVGILAVLILPRFGDASIFAARGFHDATAAALRYAQKAAIAQRRTVCVAFASNGLSLNVASTAGASPCDTPLNLPASGGNSLSVADARYQATPTDFSFNALGEPSLAQTLQVEGNDTTLQVEAGTGYVHD